MTILDFAKSTSMAQRYKILSYHEIFMRFFSFLCENIFVKSGVHFVNR